MSNGLFLYLNIKGKPLRFWPEKKILEYNKKLNNGSRVFKKKQEYLETLSH
jgi:DNA-binding transcriptional MerR regulator